MTSPSTTSSPPENPANASRFAGIAASVNRGRPARKFLHHSSDASLLIARDLLGHRTSPKHPKRFTKANSAELVRFDTRCSQSHMRSLGSGGAWTKKSKPIISENFFDDIYQCLEWAEQNDVPVYDHSGTALFCLSSDKVQRHLFKAVEMLNTNGVETRMIWMIDDLISPANFRLIAQYADYEFIRTLVQIAVDWVRVPTETLAKLEEVVRKNIYF